MLNYNHSTAKVTDSVPCISEAKTKKPRPSDQYFEPENEKKLRLLVLKPGSGKKKVVLGGCSRAAKMIQMTVDADAIVPQKPREQHQTFLVAKKSTASNGSTFEPKELRPENIEYMSRNPPPVRPSFGIASVIMSFTHAKKD